jgi:hypothetical protein
MTYAEWRSTTISTIAAAIIKIVIQVKKRVARCTGGTNCS